MAHHRPEAILGSRVRGQARRQVFERGSSVARAVMVPSGPSAAVRVSAGELDAAPLPSHARGPPRIDRFSAGALAGPATAAAGAIAFEPNRGRV
eukprot:7380800-Prymnesium_polylepis.1